MLLGYNVTDIDVMDDEVLNVDRFGLAVGADPIPFPFIEEEPTHPQEDEEYLVCPTCGSPLCGGCD